MLHIQSQLIKAISGLAFDETKQAQLIQSKRSRKIACFETESPFINLVLKARMKQEDEICFMLFMVVHGEEWKDLTQAMFTLPTDAVIDYSKENFASCAYYPNWDNEDKIILPYHLEKNKKRYLNQNGEISLETWVNLVVKYVKGWM